jgi:hypothetical protein
LVQESVQVLVLLFLAGLCAAVLTPEILRKRSETRPADSIGSFRTQLKVLQRTTPVLRRQGAVSSPYTENRVVPFPVAQPVRAVRPYGVRRLGPTPAQRRRRDILCALLAAMGGSLLLGLVPGFQVLWGFHVMLDVLFVAYVALLACRHTLFAPTPRAHAANVHRLRAAPARVPAEPVLLRRTGN